MSIDSFLGGHFIIMKDTCKITVTLFIRFFYCTFSKRRELLVHFGNIHLNPGLKDSDAFLSYQIYEGGRE